jgi:hypothetical protein
MQLRKRNQQSLWFLSCYCIAEIFKGLFVLWGHVQLGTQIICIQIIESLFCLFSVQLILEQEQKGCKVRKVVV